MKRSLFILIPLVAACASAPDLTSRLTPFRIDVRQGNYVSQEMMAQLKPGLTPDQVRYILGTPLIVDLFHANRWDYVYRFQPGKGDSQQRRVSVFFEDGKLARVSGDVVAEAGKDAAQEKSTARIIEISPDAGKNASPATTNK